MNMEKIDLIEIKNEILFTDSIFRYIKNNCCVGCIDSNEGEIELHSKHAVIMGYIKELEERLNIKK